MNDRQLMLGNEAVARGLYESGCRFVSSYPGTPSTEITEYAARYDELAVEWAPNEKVAAEAAVGACIVGARAFSGMKHVGLNVAADPIFTAAYTGVNGGLVLGVADDMGIHSSQNEQDSRHYARASKLPMLEPSDSQQCLDYTKLAFDLSEQFDTPVFLRLSTRISHARSAVNLSPRVDVPLKPYEKNIGKYVMMPANARVRHVAVEQRLDALRQWAEQSDINTVEYNGDKRIGIVAAGIAYQTAREALGDNVSYLRLGCVFPLALDKIRAFADSVETLYIIEELDDFVEQTVRAAGIACQGKALFSPMGEYTVSQLRAAILGERVEQAAAPTLPGRPPVLCPGCPHRGVFHVLKGMKLFVSGDIGCYTLGAAAPLSALDTTLCMGASISGLHGACRVTGLADKSVAVIGDSTFLHSGITGLMNAVYNGSGATLLILDNSTTGMTGHQPNPATGMTIKGDPAYSVDLEALCRAVGVQDVATVDAHDLDGLKAAVQSALKKPEVSVVICRRPCVLLKSVKRLPAFVVNDSCKHCGACLKIACPAIARGDKAMTIDPTLCVGCGLCAKVCKFNAMEQAVSL